MKHSKHRELILEAVCHRLDHPSADAVYQHLRSSQPSLSLATVYRNLGQLCQTGQLRRVPVPGASDRYDGNLSHHDHMICDRCGAVTDFDGGLSGLSGELAARLGCRICSMELIVHGTCGACLQALNPTETEEMS